MLVLPRQTATWEELNVWSWCSWPLKGQCVLPRLAHSFGGCPFPASIIFSHVVPQTHKHIPRTYCLCQNHPAWCSQESIFLKGRYQMNKKQIQSFSSHSSDMFMIFFICMHYLHLFLTDHFKNRLRKNKTYVLLLSLHMMSDISYVFKFLISLGT